MGDKMNKKSPHSDIEQHYIPKRKRNEEDLTYNKLNLKAKDLSTQNQQKLKEDSLKHPDGQDVYFGGTSAEDEELNTQLESLTLLGDGNDDEPEQKQENDQKTKKTSGLKFSPRYSSKVDELCKKSQHYLTLVACLRGVLAMYFLVNFAGNLLSWNEMDHMPGQEIIFDFIVETLYGNPVISAVINSAFFIYLVYSFVTVILRHTKNTNEVPQTTEFSGKIEEHNPFVFIEIKIRDSYRKIAIGLLLIAVGMVVDLNNPTIISTEIERYVMVVLKFIVITSILAGEMSIVRKLVKLKQEYCFHIVKVLQLYDDDFTPNPDHDNE